MKGFSLIELLLALAITLVVGLAVFHLFRQNVRVFHDQNLVREMHQAARAAASQISDEIRLAGQGIPVYSSLYDSSASEAAVAILAGSDSSRINMREGLANAESNITSPLPLDMKLGVAASVAAGSATAFSDVVGANPAGRYAYVWGPADSNWAWIRASIDSITIETNTIQLTPAQAGSAGHLPGADGVLNTPDDVIRFTAAPTISLEEGIAVYHDSSTNTIRRSTATNMTGLASPIWAVSSDLSANVTSLAFTYYDKFNNPISPLTLAGRARVARVDARLVVQSSEDLSNGTRASFALALRSIPRNARIR